MYKKIIMSDLDHIPVLIPNGRRPDGSRVYKDGAGNEYTHRTPVTAENPEEDPKKKPTGVIAWVKGKLGLQQ